MTHDEARKKIDEVISYWGGYLNHYSDDGLHQEAVDTMLALFSEIATSCIPPERFLTGTYKDEMMVRYGCSTFNRCRKMTLENIATLVTGDNHARGQSDDRGDVSP